MDERKGKGQHGAGALAAELRSATRVLHAQAERAGVMRALLSRTLGLDGYCVLLRNLHPVYESLEDALARHAANAALAALPLPALRRTEAITADLSTLCGTAWRSLPLAAPTLDYVARVRALDAGAPPLLLAHAYTRYLGDLAGGQTLRALVRALAPRDDGGGVAFYEFGSAPRVRALAEEVRAAIDGAPVDCATAAAIVTEARDAFARHVALFEALDAAGPRQVGSAAG